MNSQLGQATILGIVIICTIHLTECQQMDPKVKITETSPASMGSKLKGQVSKDVWMTCYVENLPKELSVRWQRTMFDKDGRQTIVEISQDIALQDNMKWSIEKPTPYSWRLRIKGLEIQDEGNYTCFVVLTSNNNRVMDNRTVIVTDHPIILEEYSSSDMTVKEGDFVALRCNASGIPYPTIMWRREGNAILPGGGVVIMGPMFDITNIQYDARGRYVCEALNEVGFDKRNINIEITHAPKVSPEEPNLGQSPGYSRMLVCFVDANPAPSADPEMNELYWSIGAQRIPESSKHRIRVLEGAYGRITYELIINKVQSSDYGTYTCTAANIEGKASANVKLYEVSSPVFDRSWLLNSAQNSQQFWSFLILIIAQFCTVLNLFRR